MHRTTIYLPDEQYRDLRVLAMRMGSTVSDLLRFAAEEVFAEECARFRGLEDLFSVELSERGAARADLMRGLRRLSDRRMRCNR